MYLFIYLIILNQSVVSTGCGLGFSFGRVELCVCVWVCVCGYVCECDD